MIVGELNDVINNIPDRKKDNVEVLIMNLPVIRDGLYKISNNLLHTYRWCLCVYICLYNNIKRSIMQKKVPHRLNKHPQKTPVVSYNITYPLYIIEQVFKIYNQIKSILEKLENDIYMYVIKVDEYIQLYHSLNTQLEQTSELEEKLKVKENITKNNSAFLDFITNHINQIEIYTTYTFIAGMYTDFHTQINNMKKIVAEFKKEIVGSTTSPFNQHKPILMDSINSASTGSEYNDVYSEIGRLNMTRPYEYDRRALFRNYIHQYIDTFNAVDSDGNNILSLIEKKLDDYGLIVPGDDVPKHIKYKNITREHIVEILKELKLVKYVNSSVSILNTLKKIPSQYTPEMETKLMNDFDLFITTHSELNKHATGNKKGFSNLKYILYLLLKKNNYNPRLEDFDLFKTPERRLTYELVVSKIFEQLGWEFSFE